MLPTSTDNVNHPKTTEMRSDLLTRDPPIRGQEWMCFSYVSPEKYIKQREEFIFEQFVKNWDFNKSMQKFDPFLQFMSMKYSINEESLKEHFMEFVSSEKKDMLKFSNGISDDFKTFSEVHDDALTKKFDELVKFRTNVRGIIFRGAFATRDDAKLRCDVLKNCGDNFDIHITEMGAWVPMEPDPYKIGNISYAEPDLNRLMHERADNLKREDEVFDKRVLDAKRDAMEDNKRRAEQYGTQVTQTMDDDGNLIQTKGQMNDLLKAGDTTVDELTDALFNSENIATGKTDPGKDAARKALNMED